jgi:hypothetical protein
MDVDNTNIIHMYRTQLPPENEFTVHIFFWVRYFHYTSEQLRFNCNDTPLIVMLSYYFST